jgi:uncharacterized protein (DUF58 family)
MFRDKVYPAYVRAMRPKLRRKRQGTDRSQALVPLIVFCAVLGLNTDKSLAYQLFALLLCTILISRFFLRFSKPNVSVHRKLPNYATAGQPFEYQIVVDNTGNRTEADLRLVDIPLVQPPTRQQFRTESEPEEASRNAYDQFIGFHRFMYLQRRNTGITITAAHVPDVARKSHVAVRMQATASRRGLIQLSSTHVLHPDPLNLYEGITRFENPETIVILPKRYRLNADVFLSGGRHFQPGGISASWSIGESDEFVSLRDYRDGDSMRKIHWPSSAKQNKPVVREFQDEYFVRQALVLDNTCVISEQLEEAISVAASFLLALNNSDSMLDLIYLSDQAEILTSGRGTSAINEQLEALATLKRSDESVNKLLSASLKHIKKLSGCILILSGWSAAQQAFAETLDRSGVPLRVFVITDNQSLKDIPAHYVPLPVNAIQEALSALSFP